MFVGRHNKVQYLILYFEIMLSNQFFWRYVLVYSTDKISQSTEYRRQFLALTSTSYSRH